MWQHELLLLLLLLQNDLFSFMVCLNVLMESGHEIRESWSGWVIKLVRGLIW